MNAFSQGYGALLPLRWYESILLDQAARGMPVQASAGAFAALAVLAVGFVAWLCGGSVGYGPNSTWRRPGRGGGSEPGARRDRGWRRRGVAARAEPRRLWPNSPGAGPLRCSLPSALPHANSARRPIAVVDNDLNDLSWEVIEALDASGLVKVSLRADTLEDARRALDRGKVFAIVGIAPDTERDVLKGNAVGSAGLYRRHLLVPLYKSAAALASPTPISSVVSGTGRGRGAHRRQSRPGSARRHAARPTFCCNRSSIRWAATRATWFPTAFVLILQQTLLMGAALLTGPALDADRCAAARHGTGARRGAPDAVYSAAAALSDRAAAFLLVARAG